MIDRRAAFISGALLVLTLAATAWRLALLPDWTHFPYFWPGATPTTRNTLGLVIAPMCIVVVAGTLALMPLLSKASPDAFRSWRRWASPLLIVYAAVCTAMQFFVLARSLGLGLALNPTAVGRAGLVLLAGLIVVSANAMPKLPLLQPRFKALDLDPARRAQSVRFSSRVLVLSGLAIIAVAAFAPLPANGAPLIFSIVVAAVVISFVRVWQLRREYRRERAGS